VALVGLIITVVLIALMHHSEFAGAAPLKAPRLKVKANRVLVIRAMLATLILIALFFAGVVPAKAAIIIGGLLLLTRRVKSRRIYAEIDWSLLLMFAGLFIIVAGAHTRSSARHHCRRGRASSRSSSRAQCRDGGVVQFGQHGRQLHRARLDR
jgi:Na+/H+ antiporter NhaD/arsenite permease-like protein